MNKKSLTALRAYLNDLNLSPADEVIAHEIVLRFYRLFAQGGAELVTGMQAHVIGNLVKTAIGVTIAVRGDQ